MDAGKIGIGAEEGSVPVPPAGYQHRPEPQAGSFTRALSDKSSAIVRAATNSTRDSGVKNWPA